MSGVLPRTAAAHRRRRGSRGKMQRQPPAQVANA